MIMQTNYYWGNRCWQEKNWKYGKLLLIWQNSATDSGLWQLFLPGCGPKDLPEDHRFNPSKNSAELRQKVINVNDFLDRDGIPAPPVPKKDIFWITCLKHLIILQYTDLNIK